MTPYALGSMMSSMEEGKQVVETEKRPRRFVLTERDIELLKFAHDFRLLRADEHTEALANRTYTRIHRRLKGLFDQGFLGRLERPWKKDIYYIKPPGLAALLSRGLITDEEAERRVREGELKDDLFLDHELSIADFHILLSLATRSSRFELDSWKQGRAISDSFEIETNSESKLITVDPDAFFTIRQQVNGQAYAASFLVESDQSTMPKKERAGSRRMDEKVRKYESYICENRPRHNSLQVPYAYILTITLTRARRDSLAASAANIVSNNKLRKFFLYASVEDLPLEDPAAVFNPVFMRSGDTEANRYLLPWLQNADDVLK